MRTGTILFCAVLFLAAGCTQVPRPATFPYYPDEPLQRQTSYLRQQQLQSATHWLLIAKLTAERLSSDPDLVDILQPDPRGNRPPIYVQDSDKTPFGQAFLSCLITELKDNKFKLSDIPDGPINLRWDIQPVYRNADRPKPFFGIPFEVLGSAWTLLFGNWNTTDFMATHSEIIITTRVTIGKDSVSNIIKSYTDIFYINDGDWDNYQVDASGNVFSRSIAGKDEAWRRRLAQQGLLSQ